MAEQVLRGRVVWFNAKKGYGFIQYPLDAQDPKEVFVHYSGIKMNGYRSLAENDEVDFIIQQGEKGPQAAMVVVFKKGEPSVKESQHESKITKDRKK